MKQIMTMLTFASVFILVGSYDIIGAPAQEIVIESIRGAREIKENTWEERSLIQTTYFEDEYMGAVRLGAFKMPECDANDSQYLREEASKCVVRVVMGQYAGSGLIWRMEEEGIVVASNKHLLREAAYGTVTIDNSTSIHAEIMGYSQEYDIGFLLIPRENLTTEVFRKCYEVNKAGNEEELGSKELRIIQIASSQENEKVYYEGRITGMTFVPEFQNTMLQTACYAKAGMSGGGVFNENGLLVGMIAGGAVDEFDSIREAEITYSIPVAEIEKEYQIIRGNE